MITAFALAIIALLLILIVVVWSDLEQMKRLHEAVRTLHVSASPVMNQPPQSTGLPTARVMYRNGDSWTEGQWVRVDSPAYRSAAAVKHESGEIEVRRG